MKNNFNEYINIIIEQYFLNFGLNSKYNDVLRLISSLESENIYKIQQLTFFNSFKFIFTLFSTEIFLFLGLITIILQFGLNFNKISSDSLLLKTNDLIIKFLKIVATVSIIQWVYMFIKIDYIIPIFHYNLDYLNKLDWIKGFSIFHSMYQINFYTQTLKVIIILLFLCIFSHIINFLDNKIQISNEICILLYMALCFGLILVSTTHFIAMLLALEGFSLLSYILAILEKTQGGITAAVKYFIFGTLGSISIFWGVVHLYVITPDLSYNSVSKILIFLHLQQLEKISTTSLFLIILLGFLIKIGAAPLHAWVPDVYVGSSLFINMVFSTFIKFTLIMVFYRIVFYIGVINILDFIAFISIFVGTLLTLRQTQLRRFLAYSSITHVGFLLISDVTASFIYMLTYLISILLFFSVLLSIKTFGNELIYLNDLKYIKNTNLLYSLAIIVSIASMAGLPPFAGFYGKFMVISNLIEDIYIYNDLYTYLIFLLVIILTLISIFYYIRIILYIFTTDEHINNFGVEIMPIFFEKFIENWIYYVSSIKRIQVLLIFLIIGWTFLQPLINSIAILVSLAI